MLWSVGLLLPQTHYPKWLACKPKYWRGPPFLCLCMYRHRSYQPYILHDAYIFHAMIAEVPAFVLNVITGLHLHCSSTSRAVQSVCKQ